MRSGLRQPVLDWPPLCDTASLAPAALGFVAGYESAADDQARDRLLNRLWDRAHRDGDPGHVRVLAAILAVRGENERAYRLLHHLVSGGPVAAPALVELARAATMVGMTADAQARLRQAAALTGANGELAGLIQNRLSELDAWIAWRDEQMRFHRLRIAALRERFEHAEVTVPASLALARSLFIVDRAAGGEGGRAEALAVLQRARQLEPESAPVLELLVYAYLSGGDDVPAELLRTVERVAPHSSVIEQAGAAYAERTDDFQRRQRELLNALTDRALRGDAEAAREIRNLYHRNPHDIGRLSLLMFVEMAHGDRAEAAVLADRLRAMPDLHHSEHFNLFQVLWRLGRREEAARHMELAYRTARSDEERDDVIRMREYLTGEEAQA